MTHPLLHAGPAVGFEQPFEMLEACHERLRAEHGRMGELWVRLRPVLQAWSGAAAEGAVPASFRADAQAFGALYAAHIPLEESLVFPAARAGLGPDALQAMGDEMRARRGAAATIAR